jgi:hypothetical protein
MLLYWFRAPRVSGCIKCGANAIVTTNIKHFPDSELSKYNVVAIHPDDFVLDQIGRTAASARIIATAIVAYKKSLRKSRTNWKQYLEVMSKPGVGLQNAYTEVSSADFRRLIADVIAASQ